MCIRDSGTEEQKRKYLPDLLSGKKIGAFGLTEPNAGTDASGQQTMAVLEGDHYVLNGSKCFITNGNVADTFVVFAMTDKSKGNHGISAFIVEKDFPGFSTGKHEKKTVSYTHLDVYKRQAVIRPPDGGLLLRGCRMGIRVL